MDTKEEKANSELISIRLKNNQNFLASIFIFLYFFPPLLESLRENRHYLKFLLHI